jgi:hypothetical protein
LSCIDAKDFNNTSEELTLDPQDNNEIAVDAACFYTWKTLCKLYEKEANTSKEIVDLLINCINN